MRSTENIHSSFDWCAWKFISCSSFHGWATQEKETLLRTSYKNTELCYRRATRTWNTFMDELQEHGTLLQTSYKDMEYFYGRATRTRNSVTDELKGHGICTFMEELQEHGTLLQTSYKDMEYFLWTSYKNTRYFYRQATRWLSSPEMVLLLNFQRPKEWRGSWEAMQEAANGFHCQLNHLSLHGSARLAYI